MRVRRVGVYVAAFDPIHDGQIRFALEAAAKAGLEKIFLLVDPSPSGVQGVKALQHRLAMARLASADYPNIGVIALGLHGLALHDAWSRLRERFRGAEVCIVLESSGFSRLSRWSRIDVLEADEVQLILGTTADRAADAAERLQVLQQTRHIRLSAQVLALASAAEASVSVRPFLRKGAVPPNLNKRVARYIAKNRLYNSGDAL